MPREAFAVTLKMLRLQHGLTQQELAEKLGISAVTISGYELGRREPSIEILERIADCFGVSVDYLLGRTNELKNDLRRDLNDQRFFQRNDRSV